MNRIKELLRDQGMTQEELSFRCDVPQPEISRIANGKKQRIHLETAAKIARALGKSVEYVFPDY
jgi:transcriptional regulator with XRE-family HTH domain